MKRPRSSGVIIVKTIAMPSGCRHAAAEALDGAEGDQAREVPGQAAEGRAEREADQRDHVEPLHADAVGEEAAERDDDGEGEQ